MSPPLPSSPLAQVELEAVSKAYGTSLAVDAVSFAVGRGELLALLGPSGCGKTTTLRMVAGFIVPTGGRLRIGGRDVTRVAPHKRDTGMVFQSYALFPHMTVGENIAFGLRRRRVPRAEREERIARMVGLLRLDGLEDRLPRQLSGGQQQRVAVGRALVVNPAVLLLDEPFSNLDAQLRESTRVELRRIQQELGLTAIFVTHDQSEAMAIADRVAVMDQGRLVQLDTPQALYARPKTRFVASFIGRANLIDLVAREAVADGLRLRARAGFDLLLEPPAAASTDAMGENGAVVLRPEAIILDRAGTQNFNCVAATVEGVSFLGPTAQHRLRLQDGSTLLAEGPGERAASFPVGAAVTAHWPAAALSLTRD